MSFGKLLKFSLIYISIFTLIHVVIFGIIKNLQKNYNQENLNKIIFTVSPQRAKTDNPCENTIAKEPYTTSFYKFYIFCNGNEKPATSTIDLNAVYDKTVKGVIVEFARIMNFDPKLLLDNNCYSALTGKLIDPNSIAVSNDTLQCHFNQKR